MSTFGYRTGRLFDHFRSGAQLLSGVVLTRRQRISRLLPQFADRQGRRGRAEHLLLFEKLLVVSPNYPRRGRLRGMSTVAAASAECPRSRPPPRNVHVAAAPPTRPRGRVDLAGAPPRRSSRAPLPRLFRVSGGDFLRNRRLLWSLPASPVPTRPPERETTKYREAGLRGPTPRHFRDGNPAETGRLQNARAGGGTTLAAPSRRQHTPPAARPSRTPTAPGDGNTHRPPQGLVELRGLQVTAAHTARRKP